MEEKNNELFDEIIDIPNNSAVNNTANQTNTQNSYDYNFNFETQTKIEPTITNNVNNLSNNSNEQPEVLDFSEITNVPKVEVQEQKKQVNQELLNSLNKDTNSFVNPDLIVNPNVKKLEEKPEVSNIEEPKVDYKEINNKRNYAFMIIIFLIIIVFIIFLPQIVAFLGI